MSDSSESVFGRMPLLPGEREYGTLGANSTCFAYGVATWCFLTGGYVAELVGALEGLICLVAGNMIGVLLASLPLSFACQENGLEQIDACRPAFGPKGMVVVLVLYLINMIGWSGLILVMFGNGIRNIVAAFGFEAGDWIVSAGVALGIGLSFLVVTRGVAMLNRFNAIITPGLVALVIFLFYMLFVGHGWEAISQAEPLAPGPSPLVNYLVAVELGIASGFSWWGGIGFLARNTRTRRNAIFPEVIQLGFSAGAVCAAGTFSALVVQSSDPTEWMIPLGGVFLGVIALIFVALANVTSTAVSVYASGLALRHLRVFRGAQWKWVVVAALFPCLPFVFWPGELSSMGDAFLAYNGTMYAPISGILLVDYFFLRRRGVSLWSIFEDGENGLYYHVKGINWLALGALLMGQVLYVFLYNPFSGATHEWLRFANPSLASFLLSGLFYGLGMLALGGGKPPARVPGAEPGGFVRPNI
ncbi:MAG: cytosine permease [Myxococcota bacterium]|nr:cytosine permease [Myxococcota bacterium]